MSATLVASAYTHASPSSNSRDPRFCVFYGTSRREPANGGHHRRRKRPREAHEGHRVSRFKSAPYSLRTRHTKKRRSTRHACVARNLRARQCGARRKRTKSATMDTRVNPRQTTSANSPTGVISSWFRVVSSSHGTAQGVPFESAPGPGGAATARGRGCPCFTRTSRGGRADGSWRLATQWRRSRPRVFRPRREQMNLHPRSSRVGGTTTP